MIYIMALNRQLKGYDYNIEYNQIKTNITPRSEQDMLKLQQNYSDRRNKLYIVNIVCIFVICIILYLTWYFTKNLSKDTLFFRIGIFFFVCYLFRHYLILTMIALMLTPSMLIDSVPLGCVRTETGTIDCM